MLRTFLEKQVEHESLVARRPCLYMRRRYTAEPQGRGTLRKVLEIELMHLKGSVAEINRIFKKRSKWEPRGMILSQDTSDEERASFSQLKAAKATLRRAG